MIAIQHAAAQLAEAEQAEEAAAHPLEAARRYQEQIQERIDAISAEREQIRIRRATGNHQLDDAGRIGLLDIDAQNLREMLLDADASVRGAAQAHQSATTDLRQAREALEAAEAWIVVEALQSHARELAALTRETLDRHEAAAAKLRHVAEFEQTQRGLFAVANELDGVLLTVMVAIRDLGSRYGAERTAWAPSEQLMLACRLADGERRFTASARETRAA
jgi:chromosome segregation ATPase